MTVTWRREGRSEFLHCRIENTSSHTLELNEAFLPWNAPGRLQYTVLNAQGALIFHNWILDETLGQVRPRKLNAGQVLEGDIDLAGFSFYKAAAHEDLLMMWGGTIWLYGDTTVYGIPGFGGAGLPVSGITFLPKHE